MGGLIDKCISVMHGVPGPCAHIWTLCPPPPLDSYTYAGIASLLTYFRASVCWLDEDVFVEGILDDKDVRLD